ncbi:hypothetical protein T484DRAFT_1909815, partial [Baffinella frigidus]
MPAKAGKKDASKQGGDGGSELERWKRLILERAKETRKEFAKCNKLSKSAEKFKARLKEVPDAFKTELIMVRLSLLEGVAENEKKRGSKLSQEIDDLCTTAVNLQPCWLYAMEKCATLLRSAAMLPERAQLLVHVATNRLERAGGRPTDDKVFCAVMDDDQECKLNQMLDLDGNAEDVEYLTNRLQLQLLMAENDMIDPSTDDPPDPESNTDPAGNSFPGVKIFSASHLGKMKIIGKIQHMHQEVKLHRQRLVAKYRQKDTPVMSPDEVRAIKRKQIEEKVQQLKKEQAMAAEQREKVSEEAQPAPPLKTFTPDWSSQLGKVDSAKRKDSGLDKDVEALCEFVEAMSPADRSEALRVPFGALRGALAKAADTASKAKLVREPMILYEMLHVATQAFSKGSFIGRSLKGDVKVKPEGEFRAELKMMLWRCMLQENRDGVEQQLRENPGCFKCPWDPDAGERWHEHLEDADAERSGVEREQLRSQLCNFLLEMFPESTELFKRHMQAELEEAGVETLHEMLPLFQLEDLRRILLLFYQHKVGERFRDLQKMVGRTHPEVVCVDVMPGIDRQVVYGKVESDETVQLVREFCGALTNAEKKEQHFHEAPKKHLDQGAFFYSQVHTREAGSLLELLKLEHVGEMSVEELVVDVHGKFISTDSLRRLDVADCEARPRGERQGPYVDAANQLLDFSPGAGRRAGAGAGGEGGKAVEASEALDAEEEGRAGSDGEADKAELIRIILGVSREWPRAGADTTMQGMFCKAHAEEIRARERWKETLQQQMVEWNQKASAGWQQTRRLEMLRLHRKCEPMVRALCHAGVENVRHHTWVRVKSVQEHCTRIVQMVEELEERHRQVRDTLTERVLYGEAMQLWLSELISTDEFPERYLKILKPYLSIQQLIQELHRWLTDYEKEMEMLAAEDDVVAALQQVEVSAAERNGEPDATDGPDTVDEDLLAVFDASCSHVHGGLANMFQIRDVVDEFRNITKMLVRVTEMHAAEDQGYIFSQDIRRFVASETNEREQVLACLQQFSPPLIKSWLAVRLAHEQRQQKEADREEQAAKFAESLMQEEEKAKVVKAEKEKKLKEKQQKGSEQAKKDKALLQERKKEEEARVRKMAEEEKQAREIAREKRFTELQAKEQREKARKDAEKKHTEEEKARKAAEKLATADVRLAAERERTREGESERERAAAATATQRAHAEQQARIRLEELALADAHASAPPAPSVAPTAPPPQPRACVICGRHEPLVSPDGHPLSLDEGSPEAGYCESCWLVVTVSEEDVRNDPPDVRNAAPSPLASPPPLPRVEGQRNGAVGGGGGRGGGAAAGQAVGGGASVAAAGAGGRKDGAAGVEQGKKVPLQEAGVGKASVVAASFSPAASSKSRHGRDAEGEEDAAGMFFSKWGGAA